MMFVMKTRLGRPAARAGESVFSELCTIELENFADVSGLHENSDKVKLECLTKDLN